MATRPSWPALVVLAAGSVLRIALGVATPADVAYDDHWTPVELAIRHDRLPRAGDCWQCYQPPLFYVTARLAYNLGAGTASLTGAADEAAVAVGRKAIQFVSVIAGCLTLYVCLLILRRVRPSSPLVEAVALGLPAFLPQHLYMSAMVTNDALTYLVASLAILAAIRACKVGWTPLHALGTGLLAGMVVLCKAYGLVTVTAIVMAFGWFLILSVRRGAGGRSSPPTEKGRAARGPRPASPHSRFAAAAMLFTGIIATGVWPTVRSLSLEGRWHVDNFQIYRTGMHVQPPGSIQEIDFWSLRFGALLRRPWIHVEHVDSYWTGLFARYWFDYEGLTVTLRQAPEWQAFTRDVVHQPWSREVWRDTLAWERGDVPADLMTIARAAYVAGLPVTLIVLWGAILALGRARHDLPAVLLLLHAAGCMTIPLVQTLRLPHFAAMKAAFTLSALSSTAYLLALALSSGPIVVRRALLVVAAAALIVLLACNIGYVLVQLSRVVQAT